MIKIVFVVVVVVFVVYVIEQNKNITLGANNNIVCVCVLDNICQNGS